MQPSGQGPEHFPAKWIPVRRQKMRQNNNLERRSDSIRSKSALVKRQVGLWNLIAMVLVAASLTSQPDALAVQPDEVLANSALEVRARALSHQFRCLVCQNQSIDDSDAPLARDLRILVRERLVAGDSDAQVKDFLVARFGDFVLLKPPLKGSTLLLWLTPVILLLGGGAFLVRQMNAQKAQTAQTALTEAEERALSELMHSSQPGAGQTSRAPR
jgi:cytochrome c-type biogenesis protein CcmH